MNYKYRHYDDFIEWKNAINLFLKKKYIKSHPSHDVEDMIIKYESNGKTLAVWDLVDDEGWLITDEYYHNKSLVEQLIGAFSGG